MRLKKIPIAAFPLRLRDLFYRARRPLETFQQALAEYLKVKHCLLVSSGTAALFLILKSLSSSSGRKEVVLPAYTAHSMLLPIARLGLRARLCDIDLKTFNLDTDSLQQVVSENTLCVIAVHLFGIPCDIERIAGIARAKGAFVIEDAALALGSSQNGRMSGGLADAGFFSFGRGKNLPTYSGGCIVTNSKEFARGLDKELGLLREPGNLCGIISFIKLFGLSLAARPLFYGLLHPFIRPFKSLKAPSSFSLAKYGAFKANVGLALLERFRGLGDKRYENGMFLLKGLTGIKGITLPEVCRNARPAFNRFPVIFKDIALRKKVENKLQRLGFEVSYMYVKPVHHHSLGLGYAKSDFPNAGYLAGHLLAIPVHPVVRENDLERMIQAFKEILI